MTTLAYYDDRGMEVPAEPGISFISIFAAIFIIGAVSVAPLPGFNMAVRAIGGILLLIYIIRWIRTSVKPSREIFLYLAWIAWSLTALIKGPNIFLFGNSLETIIQIWALLVILAGFTNSRKVLSLNLAAFTVGTIIVGGYSYLTGEYNRAAVRVPGLAIERVAGIALNANAFAWVMLLATVCFAMFFVILPRKALTRKAVLIGLMLAAGAAIVMSGSRKGLLCLGVFYVAWLWCCYRRDIARRPAVLIGLVLGGVIGFGVLGTFVMQSQNFKRIERTITALQGGSTKGSGIGRLHIYEGGLQVFSENPVVGVGLDNLRITGPVYRPAHSEYLSLLANTGLPGALIYLSIFVLLWRRASRIAKYTRDPVEQKIAKLIHAMLIMVFVINFGRWNYSNKPAWIIFGSFIGYTHTVWRRILAEENAWASDGAQWPELTAPTPTYATV